jgi:hypothetical protein
MCVPVGMNPPATVRKPAKDRATEARAAWFCNSEAVGGRCGFTAQATRRQYRPSVQGHVLVRSKWERTSMLQVQEIRNRTG